VIVVNEEGNEIEELEAQREAAFADLRFGEANRLAKVIAMKTGVYVPNPTPCKRKYSPRRKYI